MSPNHLGLMGLLLPRQLGTQEGSGGQRKEGRVSPRESSPAGPLLEEPQLSRV